MRNITFKRRMYIMYRIHKNIFMEFIRHDSGIASILLSIIHFIKYGFIRIRHGEFKALIIAGNAFRHTRFQWVRNKATNILKASLLKHGTRKTGAEILNILLEDLETKTVNDLRQSIIEGLPGLFHRRLLILSPPDGDNKGVIIIKFSNYFKYFLSVFDINKISKDYILVIEPSSSGYFDEDILCLLTANTQIIVQSSEPVDFRFVDSLFSNLWPVDVGPNGWVDQRIFFPIDEVEKTFDIIMVSIWADVKRHYHLFESLSKSSNDNIKIALVGKPWPKSMEDIKDEARYYGVIDNITFYENISQAELNIILNKSKTYLLLSKKEGTNKSIIEALNSDVPVFILEGFNYGYKYPFINPKTGGFIKKDGLVEFINRHGEYRKAQFKPSEWILANMTPFLSTKKIIKIIERIEKERSLKINKDLAVKVNIPELDYWDSNLWKKYETYYKKLSSYMLHL
jgi:Glycosyl transferases group 1